MDSYPSSRSSRSEAVGEFSPTATDQQSERVTLCNRVTPTPTGGPAGCGLFSRSQVTPTGPMSDMIVRCGSCGRVFGRRARWTIASWVRFGPVPCLAAITHPGCAHKPPLRRPKPARGTRHPTGALQTNTTPGPAVPVSVPSKTKSVDSPPNNA